MSETMEGDASDRSKQIPSSLGHDVTYRMPTGNIVDDWGVFNPEHIQGLQAAFHRAGSFIARSPRSRESLPAQALAFYLERSVKPRRLNDAARIPRQLEPHWRLFGRVPDFDSWPDVLVQVEPYNGVDEDQSDQREVSGSWPRNDGA